MRILHVTDFHYRKPWFDWLATEAPPCDLICFTGDLLDFFNKVPAQIRQVAGWLARLKQPLLFCSGNHDVDAEAGSDGEWLRNLHSPFAWGDNFTINLGGVTLASSGWETPCSLDRPVDVLLHHAPPGGCATSISTEDGQDWGDFELGEDLRSGLLPPVEIVLSGHQHAPGCWHTCCGAAVSLNPGLNAGAAVPNYIVLDLTRRRALWHEGGQLAGALRLPDAPDWPEGPLPACHGRLRLEGAGKRHRRSGNASGWTRPGCSFDCYIHRAKAVASAG